ncbi:hypothetical protein PCE1_000701 [Barthelona sp. PCE]
MLTELFAFDPDTTLGRIVEAIDSWEIIFLPILIIYIIYYFVNRKRNIDKSLKVAHILSSIFRKKFTFFSVENTLPELNKLEDDEEIETEVKKANERKIFLDTSDSFYCHATGNTHVDTATTSIKFRSSPDLVSTAYNMISTRKDTMRSVFTFHRAPAKVAFVFSKRRFMKSLYEDHAQLENLVGGSYQPMVWLCDCPEFGQVMKKTVDQLKNVDYFVFYAIDNDTVKLDVQFSNFCQEDFDIEANYDIVMNIIDTLFAAKLETEDAKRSKRIRDAIKKAIATRQNQRSQEATEERKLQRLKEERKARAKLTPAEQKKLRDKKLRKESRKKNRVY